MTTAVLPATPVTLRVQPTFEGVRDESLILHRLVNRAPPWVSILFAVVWLLSTGAYLMHEAHRHMGLPEILHVGIVPMWLLMGYLCSPERRWNRLTPEKVARWNPQLLQPYTFVFGEASISRTDPWNTIRIDWREVRSLIVTPGGLVLRYGIMSLSRFWVPRSALDGTNAQEEILLLAVRHRARIREERTVLVGRENR